MVYTGNVPGVYLQQPPVVSTAQLGGIDEFKSIIILGTSTTGTNNTLTDIYSYADFQTKFGVSSSCDAHVKSLFANYPSLSTTTTTRPARVRFFKAFDTGGSPTTTTHLTAGITAITLLDELPLGILLAPEAYTVTSSTDTTTLFGLLDTLAKAKGLLHFADFRSTVNTAALVSTAADGYLSTSRAVAAYYGWNLESAIQVPLSVIAAAQALRCFDERGQFTPPAGKYAIASSSPQPSLLNATGQETIHAKRVNYIRRLAIDGVSSDLVWGTRMMSTDENLGFLDINTYVSAVITERTVTRDIQVFQSISDQQILAAGLKASLTATLTRLSNAGAYQRNITITKEFVVQRVTGQIVTVAAGTPFPQGFLILDPIVIKRQQYVDFVYIPVTTQEQVILRSARIAV